MTIGLIFWILMLIWLVFSAWSYWPNNPAGASYAWGNTVLLFVLFLLLGWGVFGAPVKG